MYIYTRRLCTHHCKEVIFTIPYTLPLGIRSLIYLSFVVLDANILLRHKLKQSSVVLPVVCETRKHSQSGLPKHAQHTQDLVTFACYMSYCNTLCHRIFKGSSEFQHSHCLFIHTKSVRQSVWCIYTCIIYSLHDTAEVDDVSILQF